MTIMILAIGLLFSAIGGYLCFGLANGFSQVEWINWLFSVLGFSVVFSCALYMLFGKTPPERQKTSFSTLLPLLAGILLGSWLDKD